MKKSRAFVPAASPLEDRIALSSGVSALDVQPPTTTADGTPVLTSRAFHQAIYGVHVAYRHFTHDGYNYDRLNNDLDRAVGRVPYNSTDGLTTTLSNDVAALQSSVGYGPATDHTLSHSRAQVIADLKAFVSTEVAHGRFVYVVSNQV